MYSNQKLVISGDTMHYYRYSQPIEYGEKTKLNVNKSSRFKVNDQEKEKSYSSCYRAKKQVKLLLQSNAYQYKNDQGGTFKPVFLTLTFAENITGLQQANRHFRNFVQRLNYNVFSKKKAILKYLVVPEFQQRGAVHYHIVFFNLPYVENIYDRIMQIWGKGFAFVETINNLHHLTSYVSKYITKNNQDERLQAEKSYFTSKGLYKPLVYRRETFINSFFNSVDCILSYRQVFEKFTETITYECYSLNSLQ